MLFTFRVCTGHSALFVALKQLALRTLDTIEPCLVQRSSYSRSCISRDSEHVVKKWFDDNRVNLSPSQSRAVFC
jgi:hypothetical protein